MSDSVFWADLGPLGRGRYVVSVSAYSLGAADSEGRSAAQLVGWAVGVMVNGNN